MTARREPATLVANFRGGRQIPTFRLLFWACLALLPARRGTSTKKRMTAPHLRLVRSPTSSSSAVRAPTPDDRALLAELAEQQAGAPAAFYRRTRGTVQRTVARLLGRHDPEVEDVTHLAFIELLRTIDTFQGVGSLDAWVRVVSARVVYRHIRRRQVDRDRLRLVSEEALTGKSEVTVRDLVFRAALRRVHGHLAKVDSKRSWTFLLHDVCGYDIREVAGITGATLAAAKSRLLRGRREVRERVHSDVELEGLVRDLSHALDAS